MTFYIKSFFVETENIAKTNYADSIAYRRSIQNLKFHVLDRSNKTMYAE